MFAQVSPAQSGVDGDEVFLLLVSAALCFVSVVRWRGMLQLAKTCRANRTMRLALALTPPVCLLLMLVALRSWADREVRTMVFYQVLLLLLGGAWLGGATLLFHWLGVSLRDDVVQRRNSAAAVAWGGGMLGVTLAYAGSNIGAGSHLEQNVFCAVLATAGLAAVWLITELAGKITAVVTIDRDLASGVRFGGLLVAAGLILGRAVAGDWHSIRHTMADFWRQGWFALVLACIAGMLERLWRPTPQFPTRPWRTHGGGPAVAYLLCAVAWVVLLGRWEVTR